MKKNKPQFRNLTLSAMFLSLAFVMPFLTGQIPQIGSMLCPMHIPVLLCGFLCGGTWGMAVGIIAPLFRSFVLGMPPMFPTAICMALELATYGFLSGILFKISPKTNLSIYFSLILSMICGRLVWGFAMFCCLGFDYSKFGLTAFLHGAFSTALPGIILQLITIPVLVRITYKKSL